MQEWTAEFSPAIYSLTPRVHVAVGYGPANISMIVGDGGIIIIIDTGRDRAAARAALAEFRKISALPVAAIIYTHSHRDHTSGTMEFIDPANPPQIWARDGFGEEAGGLREAGITIINERTVLQFGRDLPADERINNGISAIYEGNVAPGDWNSATEPDHFLRGEREELTLAGIRLTLLANTGETYDQLAVWLPDEKVVFAGDNFYRAFPNLYPIRGVPYRDIAAWRDSLGRMLALSPDHLVGGHTRPVSGSGEVSEVLTNYRDAIGHVYDKTIEGMKLGLGPDELVAYARLPDRLADLDYLRPFYGHPDWAVRSIYSHYLGWYDGNPTELFPTPPQKRARRLIALAGGVAKVHRQAEEALANGDAQWAAELCDLVLAAPPRALNCVALKAAAFRQLAAYTVNATARNYYLGVAQKLEAEADAPPVL